MIIRRFSYLVALTTVTGCASYAPRPLDVEAHRATWSQRNPEAAMSVFAQELGTPMPTPAEYDPGNGLSLVEAEIVALVFNPDLRVARMQTEVAQARTQYAGLWEDPVFSLDLLRIIESVPEPWILGTGVRFTIPVSGRLAVEEAEAASEYQAAIARAAQREWELLSDLRSTWVEWSSVTLQLEVTGELVERLDRIVEMVNRLEQAGEIPRIESRLFSIEYATRSHTAKALRAREAELQLAIKAMLGLRPEAQISLEPSLALPTPSPTHDERTIEINNPLLAVARAEYEVAEQELRREVRKQYPDLTIGPTYENEDNQSRLGFGASVPIPILNRNRQGIAEAQAQREASRAAFEAQYEALVQQLAQAELERRYRQDLRQDLESNLIPLVEAQVQDAQHMIDLGELNTLVQLESIIGRAEAKLKLVEARRAEALALNQLRTLLGPESNINPITKDMMP